MNTDSKVTDRILGGLWGAVVGDALGVPVEFIDREERRFDPVISMRGGGTWRQPPGTWSDDSSLLLCSVESLLGGFDTDDMGRKFVDWRKAGRWTPWGSVFDIGSTTQAALMNVANGTKAELAGGTAETSNGNGSLMRIIPAALHAASLPVQEMLDRVHRASAITHRHARSQMACGLYSLLARELLIGKRPTDAWAAAKSEFQNQYSTRNWSDEIATFAELLSCDLGTILDSNINSSGYVLHTLTASVWCLLNTRSYSDAVLRAVNLGSDADTTGCVTGGLAGLFYGCSAIPNEWMLTVARRSDIERLFVDFAASVQATS